MSDKAKQLAEDHWNGYVGPMTEMMMKCTLEMSRFHYVTSHVHGSKHGKEEVAATAPHCVHQKALGEDCTIGGVECWQCGDYKEAGSAAVQAETTIRKVEEARKAAENSTLVFGGDPIPRAFIPHDDEPQCSHVPFIFPACQRFMGALPGEVVKKLREEVNEVEEAYKLPYTTDLLMELYDVVHVAETAIRAICEKAKIDPMTVKAQVIQKNRLRKYYEPCGYTPAPSSLLDCAGIRCDQCGDKANCTVK